MSYHSQHMTIAIAGIRSTTPVKSYDSVFKGITKSNIKQKMVSTQEYGNTKFCDAYIFVCYLQNHAVLTHTAKAIGYKGGKRKNKKDTIPSNNLTQRLERINSESFLMLIKEAIKAKLVSMHDITTILYSTGQAKNGRFYKKFCKRVVTEAANEFKNKKNAAAYLNINLRRFNYWYKN